MESLRRGPAGWLYPPNRTARLVEASPIAPLVQGSLFGLDVASLFATAVADELLCAQAIKVSSLIAAASPTAAPAVIKSRLLINSHSCAQLLRGPAAVD